MDVAVIGHCDARFGAVRDEFARNFAERGEVGAAVCVVLDGVAVVDLTGGWADEAAQVPWRRGTLVDFYSVGKAFVALLALQLVDEGLLGLDDPSAAAGRSSPPARRRGRPAARAVPPGGVPAIRTPLTDDDLWDWATMAAAVAATEPWWEPGTRDVYHTNTYGHLIGEVVRRVSGETCRHRLAALAGPLDADVHVGVPPGERHRCAECSAAPGPPARWTTRWRATRAWRC